MLDPEAALEFLETLNKSHHSIDFKMVLKENGRLPLLRMDAIRNGCCLDTDNLVQSIIHRFTESKVSEDSQTQVAE